MLNGPLALVLCSLCIPAVLNGQSFEQALGGGSAEFGRALVLDGNNYLLAATVFDRSSGEQGAGLLRTNSNGALVDTVMIPAPGNVFIHDMAQTIGNAVVLVGSIIPYGKHDHDGLLIKVSASGVVQWSVFEDAPEDQHLFAIRSDGAGDLYVGGSRTVNGFQDGLLAKYDPAGNMIWSSSEGGPFTDEVHDLAVDATGIMATGRLTNFGGDADVFLWRTDLNGGTLWSTSWGGIAQDLGRSITGLGNGTFVVAGQTNSFGIMDSDSMRKDHAWMLAVDAVGDTLWTRAVGDTLEHRQAFAIAASSSAIYVGGERTGEGISNALAIRLDQSGNLIWEKSYDLGDRDRIEQVVASPSGFVATGWSFGPMSYQALLLRKNSNGD